MRILICKFAGLRGALAVSASLRGIKEVHPGARVTYITLPGAEAATQGCPVITDTVTYNLNNNHHSIRRLGITPSTTRF
jgi:ADP-heptose:LPS heptosyltransferase